MDVTGAIRRHPVRASALGLLGLAAVVFGFLWFRLVLGLEPRNGKLTVDPVVPEELGRVEMKGLHAFGSQWDVKAWKNTGSVRKQAGGAAS
jgi:hypothetical protein